MGAPKISTPVTGWTVGDGSGHEGRKVEDYFDARGRYLGPDEHGIEPSFESDAGGFKFEGRIGRKVVASQYRFVVYGEVRGLIGEHHSLRAASRRLNHDLRICWKDGGYTDVFVYGWHGSWKIEGGL